MKLIVLAISGLVRIIFGMIPLFVMKILTKSWSKGADKRLKSVISILMFFGGGVLLATCFLHMMPEVRDSFREAEPDLELPLSEIIFLAGFFLVYMIEDIVHSIIHQRRTRKDNAKQSSHPNATTTTKEKANKSNINANQSLPSGMMLVGMKDKGGGGGLHNNGDSTITVATTTANGVNITAFNGIPLGKGVLVGDTNSHSLSLSNVVQPERVELTSNQLRETKEIFPKNSSQADEIPGLGKSRCQNGKGGIINGAFVPEKFQYCDPDWLREMINNANAAEGGGRSRGRRSICSELVFANVAACMEDKSVPLGSSREEEGDNTHHNHHHDHHHSQHDAAHGTGQNGLKKKSENNNNAHLHAQRSSSRNHSHSHMPIASTSEIDASVGAEIRNILIVIAISFHGIFEGMAIGLQGTSADVWYLFLAVSLHECTILFCIGVELISSKTKVFRMIIYILVVSLVSPVGIAIGIIISEREYGEVIHQALIVGCFQVSSRVIFM